MPTTNLFSSRLVHRHGNESRHPCWSICRKPLRNLPSALRSTFLLVEGTQIDLEKLGVINADARALTEDLIRYNMISLMNSCTEVKVLVRERTFSPL